MLIVLIFLGSMLPIWRNLPAKEKLNLWQFILEEPFGSRGEERPHIDSREAIYRAKQVGYIH